MTIFDRADLSCDVAIIGAGTAGLAAERSARAQGARTLLIDDRFAGTTCASVGCMPSKLLIVAGQSAAAVRRAGVFGVRVAAPQIDGKAVLARVRAERDRFVAAMKKGFDDLPKGVAVQAWARFTDRSALVLDDGRRVSARAVVIATGSRPAIPEPFRVLGDLLLTNETIFELPDLPESVAVIGAGAVGLELAQALAQLGVDVEVFSDSEALAGLKHTEVKTELGRILRQAMPLRLGVDLQVRRDGDRARITWSGRKGDGQEGERTFARVLMAAGRPLQLDGLDLARTGLTLDEHGVPGFDRTTMQCGDAPIFLAGDADADTPVLHEASSEGAIAGRNAASFPQVTPSRRSPPFSITFTDPPVAIIGAPPAEYGIVGAACYRDQGRAKVEARAEGIVRLYAEPGEGRLTGAEMVGPGMDHIAHLLVLAIMRGETATSLLELPFYHPTLEEGLKPALRSICHAVHSPHPADRDAGDCPGA